MKPLPAPTRQLPPPDWNKIKFTDQYGMGREVVVWADDVSVMNEMEVAK